ncbi:MAG: hypothetical protein Q9164_007946, partial [Protoblastenia rupestris]
EERSSHPMGTTVKVKDFLQLVPVRRQNALKVCSKTMLRLRTVLQDYALSRPSVRFALKILKAKVDKGNWSYVPKQNPTTLDAAAQIYSKSLLNHLIVVHWPKHQGTISKARDQIEEGSAHEHRIEAVLPSATCGIANNDYCYPTASSVIAQDSISSLMVDQYQVLEGFSSKLW